MFADYFFRHVRVKSIIVPEKEKHLILGRVGGVVVKSHCLELAFLSVYLPPYTSAYNKRTYNEVILYLIKVLSTLPVRTFPIIMVDANCKVGLTQDDRGNWTPSAHSSVGPNEAEKENAQGNIF